MDRLNDEIGPGRVGGDIAPRSTGAQFLQRREGRRRTGGQLQDPRDKAREVAPGAGGFQGPVHRERGDHVQQGPLPQEPAHDALRHRLQKTLEPLDGFKMGGRHAGEIQLAQARHAKFDFRRWRLCQSGEFRVGHSGNLTKQSSARQSAIRMRHGFQ